MQKLVSSGYLRRTVVAFLAAGATFVCTGCDEEAMQLLTTGLEVVVQELQEEDDISFSDWLRDEIDNL